jgi:hypothetical protein
LTSQPSTYDMFALIEVYGRKLQSVYLNECEALNFFLPICKTFLDNIQGVWICDSLIPQLLCP